MQACVHCGAVVDRACDREANRGICRFWLEKQSAGDQKEIADRLAKMTPAQARVVLDEVVSIMIENQSWGAAARLMTEQLGESDALFSAQRHD